MASILIVDDDQDSRDVLCRFLESIGHTVRCMPNGREALHAVLANIPDVIVSDLMMPEMTGAGLLEVMRGYLRLQGVPVILWTGAGESLILERARRLKVNSVLIKPKATLEDLRQAIERELGPAGSRPDSAADAGAE